MPRGFKHFTPIKDFGKPNTKAKTKFAHKIFKKVVGNLRLIDEKCLYDANNYFYEDFQESFDRMVEDRIEECEKLAGKMSEGEKKLLRMDMLERVLLDRLKWIVDEQYLEQRNISGFQGRPSGGGRKARRDMTRKEIETMAEDIFDMYMDTIEKKTIAKLMKKYPLENIEAYKEIANGVGLLPINFLACWEYGNMSFNQEGKYEKFLMECEEASKQYCEQRMK